MTLGTKNKSGYTHMIGEDDRRVASLISIAVAQEYSHTPQASLDRELDWQAPDREAVSGDPPRQSPTPPSYCKPCLFYAGDFDDYASDANGLANEFDIIVSTGAAVYAPFIVPKGKIWTVTGLFTDNFLEVGVLDPVIIPYEIRKGIPKNGGNGGTLVCHGRKPATLTNTFLSEWLQIYATKVEHIKGCRLPAGKYWMSVVPYCTNTGSCSNDRGFEANDDGAMNHRFGPIRTGEQLVLQLGLLRSGLGAEFGATVQYPLQRWCRRNIEGREIIAVAASAACRVV
jgi:hypothetical protein